MTFPTNEYLLLQPESSGGQHCQESGEGGFSSAVKYSFDDTDVEKRSSVQLIPKGEVDIDFNEVAGKLCSKYEYTEINYPEPSTEPQDVSPFRTSSLMVRDTSIKQEVVTTFFFFDEKLVQGANPSLVDMGVKPKDLPPVPRTQRSLNRHRRRTASTGKNRKCFLLWVIAASVFIYRADAVKCFTCMDKVYCPNLTAIYNPKDILLYGRELSEKLPACSDVCPPTGSENCAVCNNTTEIKILCTDDVEELEVEAPGYSIQNISSACAQQETYHCHGHYGVIAALALFGFALVLMLIRCGMTSSVQRPL